MNIPRFPSYSWVRSNPMNSSSYTPLPLLYWARLLRLKYCKKSKKVLTYSFCHLAYYYGRIRVRISFMNMFLLAIPLLTAYYKPHGSCIFCDQVNIRSCSTSLS